MRFILGFFFVTTVLANPGFIDSSAPPSGFESAKLNQHLRVSVFFMHRYIGFFYIELQQGQLKFQSPASVLAQMKGIKHKKRVLHLLEQSFALNIDCNENLMVASSMACSELKQKTVYLIYKPNRETVYLFLKPSYFKKPASIDAIEYIPSSPSGLSYINKLGAAGSFSNDAPIASQFYPLMPNYYNLYSNNVLAYKNTSMIGNISQNNGINEGNHFQIQNLYAQHYARDKVYTGGYIVNPASPFFQTQIIAGAGFKTTLETVKNPENILAAPLVIFVPQASQVNIFRNEQLIFSQYLETGYQRINTNSFPEGGYELAIQVGNNMTRRFYSKGVTLPPAYAPQYYVMGGYLTNGMILNDNNYNYLPQVLNFPVLQAGINARITECLGWFSDGLINSNQGLLDFGPAFFIGNALVKAAGLITTENNYGAYIMLNAQKYHINFNLIATKIFYQNRIPDYYFLGNLIDNDSISVSYKISECDLIGVQGNYNKSLEQPESYTAGAFYQRFIGNFHGMGFFLNAACNKTIYVGDTYNLGLTVNFSEGRFAGTESLLWQNQNQGLPYNRVASPIVAQGNTAYSFQNDYGLGHSFNEIHSISPTVSSLAGTYNYTASQGFIATYLNYNQLKGQEQALGYGGNLETELAVNLNGARFNGVNRGNPSGIIAEVRSNSSEKYTALFALLDENNRKIALLPANKKIFISLPGFTDQNYTLISLAKTDYAIQEPTRHITLYPGNIDHYSWIVENRVIVIGRAVRENGLPWTNIWLHKGKNGIFTDEEGHFQLELPQNIKVLRGGEVCKMRLPKLTREKAYMYIGDVLCS